MRHHNWGSDFLVRFATNLGTTYGLYLGSDDYPDHNNFSQVHYLDTNYQIIDTRAVVRHDFLSSW